MNFIEAVELLKQGKKVCRGIWKVPEFIYLDENKEIRHRVGNYHYSIYIPDIEANDWEVIEEPKKTLWDKRKPFIVSADYGGFEFLEEDVKESVKEFVDWCETKALGMQKEKHNYGYRGKAKEIFGKELTL